MRVFQISFQALIILFLFSSITIAADFDWVGDFNRHAQADLPGFKIKLATRFQTEDAQISAVLSEVPKPSDAYIVFRLAEISKQPLDRVMAEYKFCRRKGWGAMAKRLCIKPGSKEFQALKTGQDLYDRE
jgi:hypothetical protein